MNRSIPLFFFTIFFTSLLFGQTSTAPSAGDGTSGNPYQIATLNNLYWITQNSGEWGKYFIQTANINASSTSGWTAPGWPSVSFSGNYDGQGYVIDGITRNITSGYNSPYTYGFFDQVTNGAVISNLGLTNLYIRGYANVGGLAGTVSGTVTISKCYTTGSISSYALYSGNNNNGGFISTANCGTGTITITNCYTRSSVGGYYYVAPFLAKTSSSGGGSLTVSKCYSAGTAASNGYVGGFFTNTNLAITGSYSAPNSFYDYTIQSAPSYAGTQKTTSEMQTQSTFTNAGWDFDNIWSIDGSTNNGYPFLQVNASPLPVELTSFTVKNTSNGIQLSWNTATEINNHGFAVERSSSTDWKEIGFVEGAGNSNAPKSYSFVDNSAHGRTSYRLKQIDRDGTFEYSKTIELAIAAAPAAFALANNYPNPFNPATNISYSIASDEFVSLKVYDMMGKEIATLVDRQQPSGNYAVAFDASQLASGIYFYKLKAGNNVGIKKMILMK